MMRLWYRLRWWWIGFFDRYRRRNRGRKPIYPQWDITGPGSFRLPDEE